MKTVLLIVMMTSFTLAGFLKARGLKRRQKELEGLIELIKNTESEISCYKRPVNEAVSNAAANLKGYSLITELSERLKDNSDVNAVWHGMELDFLAEKDVSMADEFFALLGTSGVDEQISLCKNAVIRLQTNFSEAKDNFSKKGGLYKSLGFLSGLLAVILFI